MMYTTRSNNDMCFVDKDKSLMDIDAEIGRQYGQIPCEQVQTVFTPICVQPPSNILLLNAM